MIDSFHWPTERVGLFFKSLPWSGYVETLDSPSEVVEVDWRLLSVSHFLGAIAWDGKAVPISFGLEQEQTLSYTASIRDFFSCFAWKGQPQIGTIPKLNFTQTTSSDLNLNDLSGLF